MLKLHLPGSNFLQNTLELALDAIQTSDAGWQAAIVAVKTGDKPTGKRNHFEKMASYIIPYDPVSKKWQTGGKQASSISGAEGDISSGFGSKQGIRKTGGIGQIPNLAKTIGTCLYENWAILVNWNGLSMHPVGVLTFWILPSPFGMGAWNPIYLKKYWTFTFTCLLTQLIPLVC
jgi:hypothetical protein